MTAADINRFQEKVYQYYRDHGRPFPWRDVTDPYDIAVSEIMLQQTQADRVIPKYQAFLGAFPDVTSLAAASLADVLTLWQGLGYNRRAKMLWLMAQAVVNQHKGAFPEDLASLQQLPGIGPYTAAAIRVFAFNQPAMVLETNIRSVFLHEFFPDHDEVADAAVAPLIEATMDHKNPREWYQALMDYGAMLKKQSINPSRRSAHYVRQAPLKGSLREARGAILKFLTTGEPLAATNLAGEINLDPERLQRAMDGLLQDGLVVKRQGHLHLPR